MTPNQGAEPAALTPVDVAVRLRRAAQLIEEATDTLDGGATVCSAGHTHYANLVEADALKQLTSAMRKAAYWGRVLPDPAAREAHQRQRVNRDEARAGGSDDDRD